MSNPNVPAKKHQAGQLVQPGDAAAELDRMVLALPNLENDDLTEQTLARIMMADTEEDIFANPELEGFLNLLGRPLVLLDVLGHLPSRYEGSARFLVYSVLDETTGEKLTVASGSPYVAVSALRAKQLGKLPTKVRAMALDSKEKQGQQSLWLVKRTDRSGPPTNSVEHVERIRHMTNDQEKFPYLKDQQS